MRIYLLLLFGILAMEKSYCVKHNLSERWFKLTHPKITSSSWITSLISYEIIVGVCKWVSSSGVDLDNNRQKGIYAMKTWEITSRVVQLQSEIPTTLCCRRNNIQKCVGVL